MKVSISNLTNKANIKFGTSGLRGLVTDLSDIEYNARRYIR